MGRTLPGHGFQRREEEKRRRCHGDGGKSWDRRLCHLCSAGDFQIVHVRSYLIAAVGTFFLARVDIGHDNAGRTTARLQARCHL